MREPLLDWQREARQVNAKRSTPHNAQDATSSAEAAGPEDTHVNLKVSEASVAISNKPYNCRMCCGPKFASTSDAVHQLCCMVLAVASHIQ